MSRQLRIRSAADRRHASARSDATAVEVAKVGVLRAIDHLVAAGNVELAVTPPGAGIAAHRRAAIFRFLQEALYRDDQTGTSAGTDEIWTRFNSEGST
jgi:hypothetical protein